MFWYFALPFSLFFLYGSFKYSFAPEHKTDLNGRKYFHLLIVALLPFLALYGLMSKAETSWEYEWKFVVTLIFVLTYGLIMIKTVYQQKSE